MFCEFDVCGLALFEPGFPGSNCSESDESVVLFSVSPALVPTSCGSSLFGVDSSLLESSELEVVMSVSCESASFEVDFSTSEPSDWELVVVSSGSCVSALFAGRSATFAVDFSTSESSGWESVVGFSGSCGFALLVVDFSTSESSDCESVGSVFVESADFVSWVELSETPEPLSLVSGSDGVDASSLPTEDGLGVLLGTFT